MLCTSVTFYARTFIPSLKSPLKLQILHGHRESVLVTLQNDCFFHNGRFLNVKLRGSRWRPHSLCLFVCTVLGEKGTEKPEIEFILIQPPRGASTFAFFYPA